MEQMTKPVCKNKKVHPAIKSLAHLCHEAKHISLFIREPEQFRALHTGLFKSLTKQYIAFIIPHFVEVKPSSTAFKGGAGTSKTVPSFIKFFAIAPCLRRRFCATKSQHHKVQFSP